MKKFLIISTFFSVCAFSQIGSEIFSASMDVEMIKPVKDNGELVTSYDCSNPAISFLFFNDLEKFKGPHFIADGLSSDSMQCYSMQIENRTDEYIEILWEKTYAYDKGFLGLDNIYSPIYFPQYPENIIHNAPVRIIPPNGSSLYNILGGFKDVTHVFGITDTLSYRFKILADSINKRPGFGLFLVILHKGEEHEFLFEWRVISVEYFHKM